MNISIKPFDYLGLVQDEPSQYGWTQLSSLLRFAGVVVVLCGLGSFMYQGWQLGNDVYRYGLMLAIASTFLGLAFLSAAKLKQKENALAFFGLAAVAQTIIASVLGAFLLIDVQTLLSAPAVLQSYPQYFTWQSQGIVASLLLLLVSAPLMLVASYCAFKVWVPSEANKLHGLYVIGLVLLLLPFRQVGFVLLAVIFYAAALRFLWSDQRSELSHIKTRGSQLALILCLLPLIVLLTRFYSFYAIQAWGEFVLALFTFLGLKQIQLWFGVQGQYRQGINLVVEWCVVVLSIIAAFILAVCSYEVVEHSFDAINVFTRNQNEQIACVIAALVWLGASFELAMRSVVIRQLLKAASVITTGLWLVVFVLMIKPVIFSVFVGVAALLIAQCGLKLKERYLVLLGLSLVAVSGLDTLWSVIELLSMNLWWLSAIIGVLMILLAGHLEAITARCKALLAH